MQSRNRTAARLTLWLSVLASLAYLGGGIGLMASSQSFSPIPVPEPGPFRYALGALLTVYGLFRGYRAINRFRDND
jgi:hypothetical protein